MDFTTPVGWMPPFHICKIAIIACTILKFFAWPCFVKWVRSFYSSNWMGKGTCWNCAFFMYHKVHTQTPVPFAHFKSFIIFGLIFFSSLNFSSSAQLQISWSKLSVFLSKSCSNLESQNHKFPKLLEKHGHKLPMNLLLLLQMSLYCLMTHHQMTHCQLWSKNPETYLI